LGCFSICGGTIGKGTDVGRDRQELAHLLERAAEHIESLHADKTGHIKAACAVETDLREEADRLRGKEY